MTDLRDVPFSVVPGFRPLALDVLSPEGAGPHPVVVFVHGGGWRVGDRRTFVPTFPAARGFDLIRAAGFAVVSIDYRLTGEAVFPAQLDDVRAALAWVRAHGPEHGLDATRMVLWGESAGGHLSALAGLDRQRGVRGVVDWYGPSDLIAFPAPGPDDERPTREESLVGGPIPEHTDLARAASPARRAHAEAPPFHIAHGDADDLVPPAQSEALHEALRAQGVESTLTLVPGAGHMWRGVADPAAVMDPALAFARRVTA
ncbi:alpha/beta hydrolase fold domain-containing protein [Microbacterium phosphatis]|uniref:alpha/beta hydrolase n=1 Tax=Microbacterium phosphatis TaxID=3140248 RepID=UPI003140C527